MKRYFDFLLAGLGLMVLCPFLLWVGWRIKKEDGGLVFYLGERAGLKGKLFRIFKFRTMVVNTEKIGGLSTPDHDLRITRVGKFLRKYKLYELPQLINVLTGDMSLVGPRPVVKYYTDKYTDEEKVILTVSPGITDWASIWNADEVAHLKGSSDLDRNYLEKIRHEKIRLQSKYVWERSFRLDTKIIDLRLKTILGRGGNGRILSWRQ